MLISILKADRSVVGATATKAINSFRHAYNGLAASGLQEI
jgi:hypothetical protein